jgi:hypothetical protein
MWCGLFYSNVTSRYLLIAVVTDCVNRAVAFCFLAELYVFGGRGLLVDEGMAPVVVPGEEIGRGFAAKIAVGDDGDK